MYLETLSMGDGYPGFDRKSCPSHPQVANRGVPFLMGVIRLKYRKPECGNALRVKSIVVSNLQFLLYLLNSFCYVCFYIYIQYCYMYIVRKNIKLQKQEGKVSLWLQLLTAVT
jgi:hypothetical protein